MVTAVAHYCIQCIICNPSAIHTQIKLGPTDFFCRMKKRVNEKTSADLKQQTFIFGGRQLVYCRSARNYSTVSDSMLTARTATDAFFSRAKPQAHRSAARTPTCCVAPTTDAPRWCFYGLNSRSAHKPRCNASHRRSGL